MTLSGWGRYPAHKAQAFTPRDEAALRTHITHGQAVARGNGRAYGDSAIGTSRTVSMRHFNKMLRFDPQDGLLVAEAGVLLRDVIDAFLPQGWFPMVTPGTKFVTLGGMIAADVHGKNHHKDGSMAASVVWIDLMDESGDVIRCSAEERPDLFGWSLGGMGLTGIILRCAIRLKRVETAWIRQTLTPLADLDATIDAFEAADDATYSVAWIDCLQRGDALGRALMMTGEHATRADLTGDRARYPLETRPKSRKTVPFSAPTGLLNATTVRAFNRLYFWNGKRNAGTSLIDWDTYFYPLDAILGWNKIYGRKGFVQFQCALPLEHAPQGLRRILEATSEAGAGSFLAVLKRLGPQESRISFPMEGFTIALDFPVSKRTLALMERLDEITVDHGGRFYLAKDARMSAATFKASDPRADTFATLRRDTGMSRAFSSKQSERLSL